ncbi:hypothetical protein T07_14562 [Trichinella nelsoni]|uniref:Uncharacterized protein n=1 Tax=Trichinella nelsoni TaxID=6336 RepID=A0A0V0S460_9BILA|nr:hypothetical protein T07_14562 [Trichinella nelsoni]
MQIKQVDYSTLHYVHDNFKYLTDEAQLLNWKMNDGDMIRGVLFSLKQLANIDGQVNNISGVEQIFN